MTGDSPDTAQARKPPSRRRRLAIAIGRPLLVLAVILWCFWFTGCMDRMYFYPDRGATPPPTRFPNTEAVWFESIDGTRLRGWFIPTTAPSAVPRSVPTILHVHGNAGNMESHVDFTAMLPPAGFNLFIFDFRGYGESEGSPTNRRNIIDDTNAALDYLLHRSDIDKGRIGVYGQSLGGAVALSVMAERKDIRAAVIESAFSSWRDIGANAVGGDPPSFVGRALAAALIPDSDRPVDAIPRIDRPILLLHGDADSIIPISHGRRLKAAAGANVELVEFRGGDHNSLRFTHPEGDKLMIDFFARHLAESR